MRPRHLAAALTLTALLLTGCSAASEDAGSDAAAVPASIAETGEATPTPTNADTAPPLVAESPSPEDAADAGYLAEVRLRLSWYAGTTAIPNATDEQLIGAGHDACAQLTDGIRYKDLRLVEGEQRNVDGELTDTGAIASAAILNYCPEFNVESTYTD